MKVLTRQTVSIDCDRVTVFNYISNMENFKHWFPAVIAIESENTLEHGVVGKSYLETVKIPLRGERKVKLKVVESNQGEKFVTEGKLPPVMPRMEVELKSLSDQSCEVVWTMKSRNNNPLFKVLMLPLAKRVVAKRAKMGMKRLKARLESDVYTG